MAKEAAGDDFPGLIRTVCPDRPAAGRGGAAVPGRGTRRRRGARWRDRRAADAGTAGAAAAGRDAGPRPAPARDSGTSNR